MQISIFAQYRLAGKPQRAVSHTEKQPIAARAVIACVVAAAVLLAMASPCGAHEQDLRRPILVQSDLGIDDAVALAMALQSPELDFAGLCAVVGVADAETGTDQLARLAGFFNRSDISVVAATPRPVDPEPEPRESAKAMIDDALGSALPVPIRDHSRVADEAGSASVTVVALGPLTRLAEILTAGQGPAFRIGRVVVSGDPHHFDDWNLGFDRDALAVVRNAGLELVFVRPGASGSKPSGWYTDRLDGGQDTALGEALLDQMLGSLRHDNIISKRFRSSTTSSPCSTCCNRSSSSRSLPALWNPKTAARWPRPSRTR